MKPLSEIIKDLKNLPREQKIMNIMISAILAKEIDKDNFTMDTFKKQIIDLYDLDDYTSEFIVNTIDEDEEIDTLLDMGLSYQTISDAILSARNQHEILDMFFGGDKN